VPTSRPSRDFKRSPQYVEECQKFGRRVRQLRERAGLTLERASSEAEMDLAHWQKIEAGKVNVTLGTMMRVANALGATVADFFARARRSGR
jgi:transcriptional regulator with XRE-family HTH domain